MSRCDEMTLHAPLRQNGEIIFFLVYCSSLALVASCADSSHRKRSVFSVAWRPDGTVASGSADKTIKLWNTNTGHAALGRQPGEGLMRKLEEQAEGVAHTFNLAGCCQHAVGNMFL
jgi:hypothetical protein